MFNAKTGNLNKNLNKKIVFNLSGHPLPKELGEDYKVVDVEIKNIEIKDIDIVLKHCINNVLIMEAEIGTKELARGNFQIVFQGMSILALCQCTLLHGITGHFPNTRYTYRIEGGFGLSEVVDLQQLRINSRDYRKYSDDPLKLFR